MSYNTDGNLAALDAYLREQDELDQAEAALHAAQNELADGLFEAYFNGNTHVVDEINDMLTEEEYTYRLIELNREYFNRPIEYHDQYRELIIEVCNKIADRYETIDDVETASAAFRL